jgi:predicted nucleotidyltransferase
LLEKQMLDPDFRDLLAAFASCGVEYLVVGGYAVGYHTRPRFTKDIDLWVRDTPENLHRIHDALTQFGAPETILDAVSRGRSDEIVWFGISPSRVDLLRHIDGGVFDTAYPRREQASWNGVVVSIIGLDDLIAAKRAAGREQDRLDLRALERVKK